MKIIEPKVKLWQQGGDAKAHIARCARVCYHRQDARGILPLDTATRCVYTHLFGYLNPYYRSAYNVSKCRK